MSTTFGEVQISQFCTRWGARILIEFIRLLAAEGLFLILRIIDQGVGPNALFNSASDYPWGTKLKIEDFLAFAQDFGFDVGGYSKSLIFLKAKKVSNTGHD